MLQPSFIDVTQAKVLGSHLKVGNASLKKTIFQNDSSQVNATQSCGGQFQGSLEGCSGVKIGSSVKVQSSSEHVRVDGYETPVTRHERESDCKIVGNKFFSLLNKASHHSKWEEFRKMAK